MKKLVEVFLLLSLSVFSSNAKGLRFSPPGKPALTRCRSPEKETFTCWWEPGSDGGLPTTHALYYRKENSETVYECPDYRTAGENSCFFNKNDTSIWVNYNITVVATNAAGSTFSDPVDIDVVYIVKPNAPEKVAVTVMEDKGWPFLRVSWEPPHKADTRSGWITLIYELRIKLEEEDDWEMHLAGQQKMFNIFSLRSGGKYLVQVRCKPDHGFWSEWSSTSYIKVPDYFDQAKSVWVLIVVFTAFIFLIITWLIHMSSRSLKHLILPPVPGPKIKGFDNQLLKNNKSDDIFSALVVSDFPPTNSSNYEDLLVEYLEVYIPEEQELMLQETKNLHNKCLKSGGSTSDSDSGRGSCDSNTLLMDKCREGKEDKRRMGQEGSRSEIEVKKNEREWEESTSTYAHEDMVSPVISSGRVKTWPSVFSPLPQYSSKPLDQQSSKQQCLSMSSYLTEPSLSSKEDQEPTYWGEKEPHLLHPQSLAHQQLKAHSDVNISSISRKQAPAGLQSPALRSTEYVEVQRVNEENMVLLQPVSSGRGPVEGCTQMPMGEDYSRVKGVGSDNVLLLQREEKEDGRCPCDQEINGVTETCYSSSLTPTQKPAVCIHTARTDQGPMVMAANGYVDTVTMCTQPTH